MVIGQSLYDIILTIDARAAAEFFFRLSQRLSLSINTPLDIPP